MAFLYGTDTRAGVPIAYSFEVGGAQVAWGSSRLLEMSGGDLRTIPFETTFEATDLEASFSDTDGSIWGSLGHGTSHLGSTFSATIYIGGTMEFETFGPNEKRLARLNAGNSATFLIHRGKIRNLSRRNREVYISSKSKMAQLADLTWRFPVGTSQFLPTAIGLGFFLNGSPAPEINNGSFCFDHNDKRDQFSVYCYVGSYLDGTGISTFYPTPSRGTLGVPSTGVAFYPADQFYYDYERYLFAGTYLRTYVGTIDTEEDAYFFGYQNRDAAELAKSPAGSVAGTYTINKTKLLYRGNSLEFNRGSGFAFEWDSLKLEASPANLWNEMLTGCCVLPLFGTSDIEADALATARVQTSYFSQDTVVDPEGGAVLPYIKDLLDPINARLSVSPNDQFRLHTIGPKLLNQSLGTIEPGEVISSEIEVDEVSKYNRIVIDYGYNRDSGSYAKRTEYKASAWAATNDRPKFIKSRWINNPNEAGLVANRLFNRYNKAVPLLKLETPLNRAGLDIGSLIAVNDSDTLLTSKIFEVSSSERDFTEDRKISFEMLDGEALYFQRGYAFWEDATSLTATVTGTSTSGWGTNGTVNNINTTLYGTQFSWF